MKIALLSLSLFTLTLSTLPVDDWSTKYRNWYYYAPTDRLGWVIPPKPNTLSDAQLTDCAIVWEMENSSNESKYRAFYTYFNGIGYQTCLATSANLIDWDFSPGVVLSYNSIENTFDYGGVTFGGLHYKNYSITAPRYPKMTSENLFHVLYGGYPTRNTYEGGHGADGCAQSKDGMIWTRVSDTLPFLSTTGAQDWENDVIYEPFLVESGDTIYDFYNAKGSTEQSGLALIDGSTFQSNCGLDLKVNNSKWYRDLSSPLIRNGASDSYDATMASDPKVFFDDSLGDSGAWVMFYFGGLKDGHAVIMIAFSLDLLNWEKCTTPLYLAGGHPQGLDFDHAHKVSIIYKDGVGYLYYTAVGPQGRGIALLSSQQLSSDFRR